MAAKGGRPFVAVSRTEISDIWEGAIVLGIDDPWIWGVYLLCLLSTLLCVSYGLANWNRGSDLVALQISEEVSWEAQEEEMQEKELGL